MGFKTRHFWCYMCSLTGKYNIYRTSTGQIATIKVKGTWDINASCPLLQIRAGDKSRVLQQRKCPATGKVTALVCSTVTAHPISVSLRGAPTSCKETRGSGHGVSDSECHGDWRQSHILVVQHLLETPLKVPPHKSMHLYQLRMILKYLLQSYCYL